MPTIYLSNCLLFPIFPQAREIYKFVDISAWITQNKTWVIYGGSFSGQETSLVTSFNGWIILEKTIKFKLKFNNVLWAKLKVFLMEMLKDFQQRLFRRENAVKKPSITNNSLKHAQVKKENERKCWTERKRELTSWYFCHLEEGGKTYDHEIQGMI